MIKSVCVFCGGNPGARPSYAAAATRLGAALAERGLALVYGGASAGLMGAVADAALASGGAAYGVLPDFMIKREIAHRGLTELELVGSMHERKGRMGERMLVKQASLKAVQAVAQRIGMKVTQRSLSHGASRWLPVVGAMEVAAYAYYDTMQVAKAAIELFERADERLYAAKESRDKRPGISAADGP